MGLYEFSCVISSQLHEEDFITQLQITLVLLEKLQNDQELDSWPHDC